MRLVAHETGKLQGWILLDGVEGFGHCPCAAKAPPVQADIEFEIQAQGSGCLMGQASGQLGVVLDALLRIHQPFDLVIGLKRARLPLLEIPVCSAHGHGLAKQQVAVGQCAR